MQKKSWLVSHTILTDWLEMDLRPVCKLKPKKLLE